MSVKHHPARRIAFPPSASASASVDAPRGGAPAPRVSGIAGETAAVLRPWLALLARFRACELDQRLAERAPCSELEHRRARQLTSARGRRRIADGLSRALAGSGKARPVLTAVIRPDASEVRDAQVVITALDRRLRSGQPLHPTGAAILMVLLTDGTSPLYRRGEPGALGSRLRAAAAALEPASAREQVAIRVPAGAPR